MSLSADSSRTRLPEVEEAQQSPSFTTLTTVNDEENALPSASEKYNKDQYIVDWDGPTDKENPRNWSRSYKAWITFQLGMLALAASMGSSIIAPGQGDIARYLGVSTETTVLTVSLYV